MQHRSFDAKNESVIENEGNADSSLPTDEKTNEENSASCSQIEEIENNHRITEVHSNNSNSMKKHTLNVKTMCVDPNLTNRVFMEDFHMNWLESETANCKSVDNCKRFNNDSVKLYNKPFKICIVSEFLENRAFTQQMVDEMCQMEWHRKQMDLYEFHQTTDLANLPPNAKPALKRFYNMLTNDMLPWMKEITGLPLTRISASCSMYNHGDYLLVHDDLLSDRQIAFVFYLSPWCDQWTDQMGGALELFDIDPLNGQPKYPIVQKFVPRNNQFVFFRVCKQSFHQVGEVTNLVYPRLTINGWFHGKPSNESIMSGADSIEEMESDLELTDIEQYQRPTADESDLNDWINPCYLKRRVKNGIQQHIEDKSEASLEMFLISDYFDTLVTEFRENTELNWVLEGPANQRKYESLHFSPNSTGPLKDLYTLFTSESMFGLLHEYTELDLAGLDARNPTCSVQLCRFTQGCYTLLGDSSTFADNSLDVILFFNARDGVGKITYLSPSQGVNEYNTTTEMDATAGSSMDFSDIATSDYSTNSTISKNASNFMKIPKPTKHKSTAHIEQQKNACGSSNTTKTMETSEDETSVDDLSTSNDLHSTKSNSISNNVTTANSACSTKKVVRAEVHESNDGQHFEVDSTNSGVASDDDEDNDDVDDDDDVDDELAREDALLTIHPKNNSLNLVYRLAGQTKFVKYISKNSLKPDEYVYVLFATYKE